MPEALISPAASTAPAPMREGNISLVLDTYDDLFSDFDPRPHGERALSDDFLAECQKILSGGENNAAILELRLFMPKTKRMKADETGIKKRLKSFFTRHYQQKVKELQAVKRQGFLLLPLGAAFSFTASYLKSLTGFTSEILFVLFEPAGWFVIWTGLDKIFSASKKSEKKLGFYKKMASMKIEFYDY